MVMAISLLIEILQLAAAFIGKIFTKADEWRGDSIEDLLVKIPTVIVRMEAGHGQIAPDRMEYLLFQGEEYLRTLGELIIN